MRTFEVKGHLSALMKKAVICLHMFFFQLPFNECLSHIKLLIKIEISFRVLCNFIQ